MADGARARVIESIGTPLGFYALALLIVEAFLGIVLVYADLTSDQKVIGMFAGVGMFILVAGGVWLIVWARPKHLMYDKEAHLLDTGKIPFGTHVGQIKPEERFSTRQVEG